MQGIIGAIVTADKGVTPPKDLLEKVVSGFGTCFGTIMAVNDGTPELVCEPVNEPVGDIDKFLEILEGNKDTVKGIWFGHATGKPSDASIQPFEILKDGEDRVLLAALLEGDYSGYTPEGSDESQEHHLIYDTLSDEIADISEACDGDIDKIIEKMKKPLFGKQLERLCVTRGVIVFFASNGEVLHFEHGNNLGSTHLGDEKPEGWWASNLCGWGKEAPAAEEKPGVIERVGRVVRSMRPSRPIAATTPAVPAGGTTISKENEKGGATDKPVLGAALPKELPPYSEMKTEGNITYIKCPIGLITKAERRTWFEEWTVPIKTGKREGIVEGYKDIPGPWAVANKKFLDGIKGVVKDFKDMKATSSAQDDPDKARHIPIIDPKSRAALQELIKSGAVQAKLTGGQVLYPSELDALQAQIKGFADQLEWPEDWMRRMDYEIMCAAGAKTNIATLAILCKYFQTQWLATLKMLDTATDPGTSDTAAEEEMKGPELTPLPEKPARPSMRPTAPTTKETTPPPAVEKPASAARPVRPSRPVAA